MRKTKNKYGFKQYIQKSLPLVTIKPTLNNRTLSPKDIVYYLYNNKRVYGDLVEIKADMVYCYWKEEPGEGYTSWGWMPLQEVFKEVETNNGIEGVPIITLDWDVSLRNKPGVDHET